jgi:coenzyme PQQ precursor peptide PqqA
MHGGGATGQATGPTQLTRLVRNAPALDEGGKIMAWTTPMLVEICVGLEINGYLPAEF